MAADLTPERGFRGPGCTDECHVVRALIPGVFGRSDLLLHDPESHEAYGRTLGVPVEPPRVFISGPLMIDVRRFLVTIGGEPVPLTPTELKLLLALARRGGAAMTWEDLIREVWGEEWLVGREPVVRHLVRTNISRLRGKLGPDGRRIVTIKAIGYWLDLWGPP